MPVDRSIEETIAREIERLGYELLAIEYFARGRRGLLRIFIDRENASITIDDCVRVTKNLGLLLDGIEKIPGPYTLEVSSPGLARPLAKPAHFRRFIGKLARVSYIEENGSKKTIVGSIADVEDAYFVITVAGQDISIGFDRMLRANLVPEDLESSESSSGKRDGKPHLERF